jgi:hypothetical protein
MARIERRNVHALANLLDGRKGSVAEDPVSDQLKRIPPIERCDADTDAGCHRRLSFR